MKAISLWQPWATLIAFGAKPYETRSWEPPKALIGQRIAIHAAQRKIDTHQLDDLCGFEAAGAIRAALAAKGLTLATLPRGAVLCTTILYGAVQSTGGPAPDLFGDYTAGRWIWSLTDVTRLRKPLPWTGRQGFFDVDLAVAEGAR